MPLAAISVEGYRSIRRLHLPVEACAVFVGPNGAGKSNLYKALGLLRAAAAGTITHAVAAEGGIESVFWAGSRRRSQPARVTLAARLDVAAGGAAPVPSLAYSIALGLPQPTEAAFRIEPLIKEERLSVRHGRRDVMMMERKGPLVTVRGAGGARDVLRNAVLPSETALAALRDGSRYPELEAVRRELSEWRLYHDFRTDAASPVRRPCHAVAAATLAADGRNLAAVLATLAVIRRDTADLDAAIEDAFPGARLTALDEGSWCRLALSLPDLPRPLAAHELSDGTLKYLCLLGALLSYRAPSLLVLNEPEASLHPSLLPALARLIAGAASRTRIWIVTHSEALAALIGRETGRPARRVVKIDGATTIEGLRLAGDFADEAEPADGEAP